MSSLQNLSVQSLKLFFELEIISPSLIVSESVNTDLQ